jgi:hypothetical protein
MNTKLAAVFALVAVPMSGCSTPPPAPVAMTPVAQIEPPPPMIAKGLPLEPRLAMGGRVCKLGTSCLEMDERPFEVCLVGGTKHCVDKGVELLPAQGHEPESPPATVTVSR